MIEHQRTAFGTDAQPAERPAETMGMKQSTALSRERGTMNRGTRSSNGGPTADLVADNIDLAEKVARLVFMRVRDYFELDELVSLAAIGIAEAAERFDPARGVPFRAFAWYRAQGAVMDGVRDAVQDGLPSRMRRALLTLEGASEYLEDRGQAAAEVPPTTAAIAAEIRDGLSAIWTVYATAFAGEKGEPAIDDAAEERIDRARLAAKARRAMDALPRRERALMRKHYLQGKNLADAGAELGLTKQAASRLHARAVELMRERLAVEARKHRAGARAAKAPKAASVRRAA